MQEYYVYMYLRDKNSKNGPIGSPYYIGKGKQHRAYDYHGKYLKLPDNKDNIRFIKENLSEDDAFMWEVFWIAEFSRIDLGTGCLHNLTDGGEGTSGLKHPSKNKTYDELYGLEKSAEIKKKLSIRFKGKQSPKSKYVKGANWYPGGTGTKKTFEQKAHQSKLSKGEANANSKLTEHEVRKILHSISTKEFSMRKLSEIYNVSYQTIVAIGKRRIWKHIHL